MDNSDRPDKSAGSENTDVPDEIRESTDEELTERIRQGDESAYGILAERYRPLTESAVKRFEPSFADLGDTSVWGEDDLRQCAALALYRAAVSYDPVGRGQKVRFGLYAKICVNNALISEFRKARTEVRRRTRRSEQEKNVPRRSDPLEQLITSERLDTLTGSIRSALTPLERDVYDRYMAGMSVEQIARALGRSSKSVSNALYRMKVKIRGLLQNDL